MIIMSCWRILDYFIYDLLYCCKFLINYNALYGSVEITCLLFTRLTTTGFKKNVETPITEESRPLFHEINNVYSNLCTNNLTKILLCHTSNIPVRM